MVGGAVVVVVVVLVLLVVVVVVGGIVVVVVVVLLVLVVVLVDDVVVVDVLELVVVVVVGWHVFSKSINVSHDPVDWTLINVVPSGGVVMYPGVKNSEALIPVSKGVVYPSTFEYKSKGPTWDPAGITNDICISGCILLFFYVKGISI